MSIVKNRSTPHGEAFWNHVEAVTAQIKEGKRMSEWIRVTERLPDYDVDVHIWAPGWNRVYLGYWRHSEEWIGRSRPETKDEMPDTDPTHWMPLPDPPKESTDAD